MAKFARDVRSLSKNKYAFPWNFSVSLAPWRLFLNSPKSFKILKRNLHRMLTFIHDSQISREKITQWRKGKREKLQMFEIPYKEFLFITTSCIMTQKELFTRHHNKRETPWSSFIRISPFLSYLVCFIITSEFFRAFPPFTPSRPYAFCLCPAFLLFALFYRPCNVFWGCICEHSTWLGKNIVYRVFSFFVFPSAIFSFSEGKYSKGNILCMQNEIARE